MTDRSRGVHSMSTLVSVLIGLFVATVDSDWPGTSPTTCYLELHSSLDPRSQT